jgi:hypothetical protein
VAVSGTTWYRLRPDLTEYLHFPARVCDYFRKIVIFTINYKQFRYSCLTTVIFQPQPKNVQKSNYLRPTVSRPVCPGVRARDEFFLLLEISLTHLLVCYFMAPSLTRGRVCSLLFLLGFASAVPLGTQDHICYCPNF